MLDFRFPTALQMVLSVAVAEKQGMRSTSATLAAALEANPSFIRKLMVPLTKDGIIVPPWAATALSTLAARRKRSPCGTSIWR